MKETKRTKGKIKNCIGIRQMFLYYKSSSENPIKYNEFTKIIKACNKELINQIVEHSEKVRLPYRLGDLQIIKFERSYKQNRTKWAVDFNKTKKEGFVVYFDQQYLYKFNWIKHYCVVKNKTRYKFTANRATKRMIAPALKRGCDYFSN